MKGVFTVRVTHNMIAKSVSRNLQRNLRSLNVYSNMTSTGHLFSRPSENPIGTYKVMKLSGTGLARNDQYVRNIGEGISWLSMTDDSLSSAIDVIQRLREMAVRAANDSHTASDRLAMVPEVRQLLEHLIDISNTQLAGLYIFGGYQTLDTPYKVAGNQGEILNSWLNKYSGLVSNPTNSIGVTINNMLTGSYAISTATEAAGPTTSAGVSVVSEYLQGARTGFFGTENITFDLSGTGIEDRGGSIAFEVLDVFRYQDLTADQKIVVDAQSGGEGEEDQRIIRLGARYFLYDLDGNPSEGNYGFYEGEDIYINLNKVTGVGQVITIPGVDAGGGMIGDITLTVASPETLTFEHNIPIKGDKITMQVTPLFSAGDNYDRFTLHKDYGVAGPDGRPTTGSSQMDWYFNDGVLDGPSPLELRFYDIDQKTGRLVVSSLNPDFAFFGDATSTEYWDVNDILENGVIDGEHPFRPAAIFDYIAPLEPYYVGDSSKRIIEISPQITVYTSITGIEAFGKNEIFEAILAMEKALQDDNQFALGGSVLADMQYNLERLLKCQSEVGSRMERLLLMEDRIDSEQIYLKELRSKVEDIDLAEIITEYMMQENVYNAALSTGARIIYPSLVDFMR